MSTFDEMMDDPQPAPEPAAPPPLSDADVLRFVGSVLDGCFDRGWPFTVDISTPATGATFRLTTPGARS